MKKVLIFMMFFFATCINVLAEGEFVTAITIDGVPVEGFDATKEDQSYAIKVDSTKDKVKIIYTYDKNTYDIQGSYGEVSLNYGTQVKSLILTNKNDPNDKKEYHLTITREDLRSSDNSLSSLTVGGSKVVLGTGNDYTVDVSSKLVGITIEAKTTSDKATFVDGYGPRTISKDSPSCEIKVKAENEEIRTYKINITKTDAKSSDATLKSLTIDKINFDFKSNVYEYELTAKSDVTRIKISATPNSDKSSLEFKEETILTTGANEVIVKVKAEDGTERTYKLKITKEEEVPLVKDIKIKDVDFTFDAKKYNYNLKTNLTTLDFDITLNSDTAKSEIKNNEELKNGSIVTIEVVDNDKSVSYNFTIVNTEKKVEKEIEVSDNNSNDNFFQKNEMIIGLVILGIGIFSMLTAILLRPKSKIM